MFRSKPIVTYQKFVRYLVIILDLVIIIENNHINIFADTLEVASKILWCLVDSWEFKKNSSFLIEWFKKILLNN